VLWLDALEGGARIPTERARMNSNKGGTLIKWPSPIIERVERKDRNHNNGRKEENVSISRREAPGHLIRKKGRKEKKKERGFGIFLASKRNRGIAKAQ